MLTVTDTVASHTRFACPFLAIDQHDCLEDGEVSVGIFPGGWKPSLYGETLQTTQVLCGPGGIGGQAESR